MPPIGSGRRLRISVTGKPLDRADSRIQSHKPQSPGFHRDQSYHSNSELTNQPELTEGDKDGSQEVDPKTILDSFKHPKAKFKVKKDVPVLSIESIWARIAVAGRDPFEINVPINMLEGTITRNFLSKFYGGGKRNTWSYPKKEFVDQHGINSFVCLTLEYCPYSPQRPGAPGLHYGHSHLEAWAVPREKIFTRLAFGEWLYQGEYTFLPCQPMTTAEYLSQSASFRRIWSEKLQSSKRAEMALCVRASILCRQELRRRGLSREPTKREIDAKLKAIKAKTCNETVTAKQIDSAFACGEEVMKIWAMKCVAYDAAFKHTLIQKSEKWKAEEKKKDEENKRKESNNKRRQVPSKSIVRGPLSPAPPMTQKRGRSPEVVESDESENDSDRYVAETTSEGEEDDEIALDNIRALGTKSGRKRVRM
ncbi:hypothetical protein BD410DRAFT_789615 [Rickenella mellea]|uniref:DUF6697 domain-containing protein n=1 Tax=Rickenella mellea TaxID=50990 RepID=A0A4Y7Q1I5_9AGAM|nr:hypothetical protein BD410DRAFT_789615 [Rickenella mellea]